MCEADPDCPCGDHEDDCDNCAAWESAYKDVYCNRCDEWGTCKRLPLQCIQEMAVSINAEGRRSDP